MDTIISRMTRNPQKQEINRRQNKRDWQGFDRAILEIEFYNIKQNLFIFIELFYAYFLCNSRF
jgi:hypothetical protein